MKSHVVINYERELVSLVGQRCCWTPYLNTNDDNWERGETNFFIGSAQIGSECHGFAINDGEHVELTLKHKGNDGGLLDYVSVHGAFGILDHFYKCRSGGSIVKLEIGRTRPHSTKPQMSSVILTNPAPGIKQIVSLSPGSV